MDRGERSRSRDRRDRSRSPGYRRQRDDRDRNRDRDRGNNRDRDYDRDRERNRESDRDRERARISERDEDKGIEKSKLPMSKASLEQLKKERLALVKRLTEGDADVAPTVSAVPVKGVPASKTSLSGHAKEVNEEGEERDDNDDGEDEDDDADMMALMGFSGFDTTKDKTHEDNLHSAAVGAVSKHKGRKYRQYMNRKGGFNRPLQKMP